MASLKRQSSESGLPEAKRAKEVVPRFPVQPVKVVLNPADCNLDFNIHLGGLSGDALCEEGFAYCWSGARANVGITRGKYCFGCKIVSNQPVVMEDTPLDQQHLCRIGISRADDSVGKLGETEYSYGFGGTGKFSNARKFQDYGEKFGTGDTIVCAVEFQSNQRLSIGFSKNGRLPVLNTNLVVWPLGLTDEGVTSATTRELKEKFALFPHILLKNVVVEMQFSIEDGLDPVEGYKPWTAAAGDGDATIGPSFPGPPDCEVIMMVGLPASGKTTWAEKQVKLMKEKHNKHYMLLGTNLALDQMKVPGLLRKNNYSKRFEFLMDRATSIFNTLLPRAASTPHNYIIDQTNVKKSARKRKLNPFTMHKKVAVVVFPKPEELKLRAQKRMEEEGKEVPAEVVNEMTANFSLPMSKNMLGADEDFDTVIFPELNRDESQRCLNEMKRTLVSSAPNVRDRYPSSFQRETSLHSSAGSRPRSLAGPEPMYYCTPMQGQRPLSVVACGSLQAFPGSEPQSCYHQRPQHVEHIPANPITSIPGPWQPGRLDSFPVARPASINPYAHGSYRGPYSTYANLHTAVHSYGSQPRPINVPNPPQGYGAGAYMAAPEAATEFQPPIQPISSGSGTQGSHPWTGASLGGPFYGPPRPRYQ